MVVCLSSLACLIFHVSTNTVYINSIYEVVMPRRYDIEAAFRSAVVVEPNGRRTLRTVDFVRELKKVNWDFSLRDANAWIEASVSTFKDISPTEGEERLFMLYNPNGGL